MNEGKTALVTGAASGIGAVIAERFLAAGYRVAWFDINEAAAAETAGRCTAPGRRIVIGGDVANESHVRDAVARTVRELGCLDVLINNAGIEIYGTVVEMSSDQWDRQLAVNLKGAYLFSKYAIPEMRRGGAIINISSAHAFVSWARCPAYDASKTGLLGLTRAMAIDHGPQGIRVNAICPGYIETPMLEKAFTIGEGDRAAVLKFHPLGRIGKPADVADAALFLASEEASFISGATLAVDGCLTAQGL
ncbi:MAG: SDR family NAD(P)-dependent oxidoreductase [Bryobacteraceae bacterium]|jgi:NAD(P)-dependent dehydrogenase (short-subunit alcohol dehydrogenase family)